MKVVLGQEELETAFNHREAGEYRQGLELLLKSAELGNSDAMFELSYSYQYAGWGLEPDDDKSNEWLEKAANAGSEIACAYIEIEFMKGYRTINRPANRLCEGCDYEDGWITNPRHTERVAACLKRIQNTYARAYFYFFLSMTIVKRRDDLDPISDHFLEVAVEKPSSRGSHLYALYFTASVFLGEEGEFRLRGYDYQATEFLKRAADEGHALAQARYYGGNYGSGQRNLEKLRQACVQGVAEYYCVLATDMVEDLRSDWAEAADWRIKALRARHRGSIPRRDGNGRFALACRVNKLSVPTWRASLRGESSNSLDIETYTKFSALRLISSRSREYRELYVYGRSLLHEPAIMGTIPWIGDSDNHCCEEIYRYSNQMARDAIIAFLLFRKRGLFNLSKDVSSIIAELIWQSRTDPIIWLK